ncbi:MAG: hypothetical protein FJZ96_03050 [Chloroflexi bacterium]|nr:hypothetical protein [Chloroflexota bacterium]
MNAIKIPLPSILVIFIAACNLPEPVIAPPTEEVATGSGPYCPDASHFGRIYEYWPALYKIMPSSPTFIWLVTSANGNLASVDDWADECVPESYTLHLSTGPDFSDELDFPIDDPIITPDITK